MNEIVERPTSAIGLRDMSTADLKTELARALEVTAENLLYLARLWRELERRGEDLSQLRGGLRGFLPAIADGRLDAQAAVQFAGNLTMLRALANQPLSVQRRLAAGHKIPVLTLVDGEWREERRPCDDLSAAEIKIVFTTGGLRSVDEQRELVGPATAPSLKRARSMRLRLTETEYADIEARAAAAGLSLQAYVLARALAPDVQS